MSGSTISTTVTNSVTVSSYRYSSPLLITNAGTIKSDGFGPSALQIDNSPNVATITNDGFIKGNTQFNDPLDDSGQYGILADGRAKITNNGVIRGGAGYLHTYTIGYRRNYYSGFGGTGINVSGAHSTILDTGKIYGGSGQVADGQTGDSGAGVSLYNSKMIVSRTGTIAGGYGGSAYDEIFAGAGIIMANGTLDNAGLIIGGAGGGTAASGGTGYFGGNPAVGLTGGTGAFVFDGGHVLNRGRIAGGAGGSHGETDGGQGGTGLDDNSQAFIINLGSIDGGAGGDGSSKGADGGIGVKLAGNTVLANYGHIAGGAAGVGGVAGNADGGMGVDGYGRFYGLKYESGTILNFGEISAGAGYGIGVRSYDGSILNAGEIYGSDGGDGVSLISDSRSESTRLVNSGLIAGGAGGVGVDSFGRGTLVNSGTISGGKDAVVFGAPNANYTSTLVVENGAVFKGDVVAYQYDPDVLEFAGTSSTAMTGIGTQFIDFGKIDFASGASWTISGDKAGLASGQKITGFGPSDAIKLTDSGASSGSVSVATAGVVSIDAGGVISKLDIAGATVGETNFKFADYTLTETAKPAMSFLFPPAAPTQAHPLLSLDMLQHFASAAPAPASLSHAGLAATSMFGAKFGASLDPVFAPHIDAVPIVTLHA